MSLVSTYVLADNGLFYKNPTLRGEDWFICFDDDDPPELVIATNDRTREALEQRATEILATAGIDASWRDMEDGHNRSFGKPRNVRSIDVREAVRCWLTIRQPISADLFAGRNGVPRHKTKAPCSFELCGGEL